MIKNKFDVNITLSNLDVTNISSTISSSTNQLCNYSDDPSTITLN